MRKRISESNIFPQFDLFTEYQKIESLISERQIIGEINQFGRNLIPQFTIEDYIGQLYFSDWNLRGTFVSIEDMRQGLGIKKENFNAEIISQDMVLDFLQYAANLCNRTCLTINRCKVAYIADKNYLSMLIEIITKFVKHLGAEISLEPDGSEVFVTYKNELGVVVADDHPDIKDSIVEYKKIDNRGDLTRKGEILCTLFKKLESVEGKLKRTGYRNLCDDATFLFNKTGIRHWVETDRIASETFLKMKPEELEIWYDRTFDMFLSCMVISKYLYKTPIDLDRL